MVLKQHPSSFTGTDLAEHLDKLGKKKIVLAGTHLHTLSLPPRPPALPAAHHHIFLFFLAEELTKAILFCLI